MKKASYWEELKKHFTTVIHRYLLMLRKQMLNPGIHRNTHRPRNPKPDPFCLPTGFNIHVLFGSLSQTSLSAALSYLPCSQIPQPAFTSPVNSQGTLDPSPNDLSMLHPYPPASMRLLLSCPPHSLGTIKEKVRPQKS